MCIPNNTKLVKCQNCGIQHPVRKCPAFGKACFICGKLNHYAKFCKNTKQAILYSLLATLKKSSSVLCNANILKPSLINITMSGVHWNGLLDTGASDCFMPTKLAKRLGLKINKDFDEKDSLAEKELKSNVIGKARADLVLGNEELLCKNVELTLRNNLVQQVTVLLGWRY